jgi:hypothetical protein
MTANDLLWGNVKYNSNQIQVFPDFLRKSSSFFFPLTAVEDKNNHVRKLIACGTQKKSARLTAR